MIDLIQDLKQTIESKNISPDIASNFIECSSRQVYRWLRGESKPSFVYRKAIKRGLVKIKKL